MHKYFFRTVTPDTRDVFVLSAMWHLCSKVYNLMLYSVRVHYRPKVKGTAGPRTHFETSHSLWCVYVDVHVIVHRDKCLIIKPTRCANFSNLFLECNSTSFGQFLCQSSGAFYRTHSNGISHRGLLTACEQNQDPDPARKLSADLYDIYHCCVYSEKLLLMGRGTVRNM
jgi:hypothetical protein